MPERSPRNIGESNRYEAVSQPRPTLEVVLGRLRESVIDSKIESDGFSILPTPVQLTAIMFAADALLIPESGLESVALEIDKRTDRFSSYDRVENKPLMEKWGEIRQQLQDLGESSQDANIMVTRELRVDIASRNTRWALAQRFMSEEGQEAAAAFARENYVKDADKWARQTVRGSDLR